MNKKFIYIIILIVAALGAILLINNKDKGPAEPEKAEKPEPSLLNCSYIIDDRTVTLDNGYAEEAVSGSNAKIITRYFGNEASGDFNNDGLADTAFILTQDHSGSGVFYYLVVALSGKGACRGTKAVLLGDRISPQTTNFQEGKIVVNFAERKIDEAMTTPPSVGVSKYFIVDGYNLVEVKQE